VLDDHAPDPAASPWPHTAAPITCALHALHSHAPPRPAPPNRTVARPVARTKCRWELLPKGFDSLIGLSGGAFERSTATQYPYAAQRSLPRSLPPRHPSHCTLLGPCGTSSVVRRSGAERRSNIA
jgi:hypothetical protein